MSELKMVIENEKENGVLSFDRKQLLDQTKLEMCLVYDISDSDELATSISIKNVDKEDDLYGGLEFIFLLDDSELRDMLVFIKTALKMD